MEQVLHQIAQEFPGAVVIGGWGTYLRLKVDKSYDVDLIADNQTLAAMSGKHQLVASTHIGGRKLQTEIHGVQIDVYVVYQSRLGKHLRIPVEVLLGRTERIQGIRTLTPSAQFVAKMAALLDRPDTLPGIKDRREMSRLLLDSSVDLAEVARILGHAGWKTAEQRTLLDHAFTYLMETDGLNKRERTALRALHTRALELEPRPHLEREFER